MKEVMVLEFRKVVYADDENAHEISEEIEQLTNELVEYTGFYCDEKLKEDAEVWEI